MTEEISKRTTFGTQAIDLVKLGVPCDRALLIDAILGTTPPPEFIQIFEDAKLGSYTGGFADRWNWADRSKFEKLSDENLVGLYVSIRTVRHRAR